MSYRILTLNNIRPRGLERLPRDRYEVASRLGDPHAILVRSADMHAMRDSRLGAAVARAGAGTNNIPVAELSRRGMPVFNAPGANANAVKELVLAGLLLAARNICQAWAFARELRATIRRSTRRSRRARSLRRLRAAGPHARGHRPGRGRRRGGQQRRGARHEGARLRSADHRAARLAALLGVQQALSLDDLFARSDVVSVHVPLHEQTRGLVNDARLRLMRPGGVMLNSARAAHRG